MYICMINIFHLLVGSWSLVTSACRNWQLPRCPFNSRFLSTNFSMKSTAVTVLQFSAKRQVNRLKQGITRQVAVYLGTDCNIGLKRAFPTGVSDKWHNCLIIYGRTSCLVPAWKFSEQFFCVFLKKRSLTLKFSKFCSEIFHRLTDRCCSVQISWNVADEKSAKSCVIYRTTTKKSTVSQTVATARIQPKICQGQPPTISHSAPEYSAESEPILMTSGLQMSSKSDHSRRSYSRTREH